MFQYTSKTIALIPETFEKLRVTFGFDTSRKMLPYCVGMRAGILLPG